MGLVLACAAVGAFAAAGAYIGNRSHAPPRAIEAPPTALYRLRPLPEMLAGMGLGHLADMFKTYVEKKNESGLRFIEQQCHEHSLDHVYNAFMKALEKEFRCQRCNDMTYIHTFCYCGEAKNAGHCLRCCNLEALKH